MKDDKTLCETWLGDYSLQVSHHTLSQHLVTLFTGGTIQ